MKTTLTFEIETPDYGILDDGVPLSKSGTTMKRYHREFVKAVEKVMTEEKKRNHLDTTIGDVLRESYLEHWCNENREIFPFTIKRLK